MTEHTERSSQERTLAALAHGSVLLGFFTSGVGGALAALVIWLTQRDRSRWVAFQALQALMYQLATLAVTVVLWCCWFGFYMVTLIPLIGQANNSQQPPAIFWVGLGSMIIPLGFMLLWVIGGLIAAVMVWSGQDFAYPLVGRWTARYLGGGLDH